MHRGIRRKCLPKPFAVALNDRTAVFALSARPLERQRAEAARPSAGVPLRYRVVLAPPFIWARAAYGCA
ncbi:MAG: hypothetical protein ACLT4C_01010 [Butyricicoccus sp.]